MPQWRPKRSDGRSFVETHPAIPLTRHGPPVAHPDWIYNHRNLVERLCARLKEWHANAARYEKTAASFIGALFPTAALE